MLVYDPCGDEKRKPRLQSTQLSFASVVTTLYRPIPDRHSSLPLRADDTCMFALAIVVAEATGATYAIQKPEANYRFAGVTVEGADGLDDADGSTD